MEDSIIKPDVHESLSFLNGSRDPIKLRQAEVRNIIFVGRSRTGKSTVFKVLKKATYISMFFSIFAETKDACLNSFTVDFDEKGESKSFTINIVDTPGLFEVAKDQGRNNEILKNTIATCLSNEITKIHCIFFVCSFGEGVNEEDILAFVEFVEFFKGAENHVALLVTHGEAFSEQRKKSLSDDAKKVLELRNLPKGLSERIFFTGALSEDLLEDGVSAVGKQLESIRRMRTILFEWIFGMKDFCQLGNLDYFRLQTLRANECLEELEAFVKGLPPKKEDFEKWKPKARELSQRMCSFERFIFQKEGQKKMQALLGHEIFSKEEPPAKQEDKISDVNQRNDVNK